MNKILNFLFDTRYEYLYDKDNILTFIDLICEEKGVEEFVQDVVFREIENSCMSYSYLHNHISIDLAKTHNTIIDQLEKSNYKNFNSFEKQLYPKIVLLKILFHEVEHANQKKKSLENDNNYENIISRISFTTTKNYTFYFKNINIFKRLKTIMNSKKYNKIKEVHNGKSPIERLANIHAYESLLIMLEPIKHKIPNIMEQLSKNLEGQLLVGYNLDKNENYPAYKFIDDLNENKLLDSTDIDAYFDYVKNNEDLDLKTRLRYGMHISKNEYDEYKSSIKK